MGMKFSIYSLTKAHSFSPAVLHVNFQFSDLWDIFKTNFLHTSIRACNHDYQPISKPFDSPSSPIFDRGEKRAWISASDYRLQERNNDSFVNVDNACGPE